MLSSYSYPLTNCRAAPTGNTGPRLFGILSPSSREATSFGSPPHSRVVGTRQSYVCTFRSSPIDAVRRSPIPVRAGAPSDAKAGERTYKLSNVMLIAQELQDIGHRCHVRKNPIWSATPSLSNAASTAAGFPAPRARSQYGAVFDVGASSLL